MAESSDKERLASPTGLVIHEPTFPDFSTSKAEPAPAQDLESSNTDNGAPGTSLVETQQTQNQHTLESRFGQDQKDKTTSRPAQQRSATERPRPSARHSILGKIQSRNHGTQLNRPTTITFDGPDDESDSSSSDEEHYLKKSPSRNKDSSAADSGKRRRSSAGPFSRLKVNNDHFRSSGRISRSDGRLKLNLFEEDGDKGYLAKTLGAVLKKNAPNDEHRRMKSYDKRDNEAQKIAPEDDEMEHDLSRRVRLNIVIIIIGSRGDIQPFIRIGKILQNDYGHRVRMATHPAFKDFVEKDCGLEFFSIGGNPAELMAFMVKNPGLVPGFDTIKEGEIGRRRAQMYEMFGGMWRACINATDDEKDETNAKMIGDKFPFIADAIIANPPSFAPPHIAEKLGIPLHMMFTFPYTPTVHFPHPLANIKTTNVEATYGNFMSYPLVELMTWQGLGDLINRFRTTILHMEEVSTIWAPGQLYRLKVPYTYMWSPSLIAKPKDWGPEIDVTGFVFLDLASSFTPPDDLKAFLDKGDPPVYIGFGSIVVDDPDAFTNMIFEAIKLVGCRALVSKGWGGFGSNADCPDNIFMLENTPHDWLFPRCSAVIHHGGAGTTAIGLKTARPTMIVPFFGDQPFWGSMVSKAKAGAHDCIPYKKLNAERLAEGIKQCLTEEARANVKKIAESIEKEGDGALNAVRSFHRSLPLHGDGSMRCDFLDNCAATWKIKKTDVKMSSLAAEILTEQQKVKWNELRLLRHYEYNDFGGAGEPITGVWGAIMSTMTDAAAGVGGVPVEMSKTIKEREKIRMKKRAIKKRKQHQASTLARVNSPKTEERQQNNDQPRDEKDRPAAKREESSLSKIEEPDEQLAEELAHEAGSGFRRTSAAIIRFPMNLSLALTQGFHNAPRLYGDETVRRPPRVTGFHSGLRAGRSELVYGVRDGVSGIVTQPIRMAKQEGVIGAAKGVGFGIGGFVLKDIAAALGPGAYFLKGLDAEYMKRYQPTKYLRRARIAQGQIELQQLETEKGLKRVEKMEDGSERSVPETRETVQQAVAARWQALQQAMEEEKKHNKSGLRGSLFGKGERKEGQRVMRKSVEEPREPHPAKAQTTPIAETEKMAAKPKKSSENKRPKTNMEDHSIGLNRSSTAPITMLERKHGDSLRPLDRSQVAHTKQQTETQGPTENKLQASTTNHLPENEHAFMKTENKSDLDLDLVEDEDFKTPLESPNMLDVQAGKMSRNPSSIDASSENTRVEVEQEGDGNKVDWVNVRKDAERAGGGGLVDVKV